MLINTDNTPDSVVRSFMLRMASLWERSRFAQALGITFNGRRDLYEAFGWPRAISAREIWEMYYRGGIAGRIVTAFPNATWGRPPQLYIKDNMAFNVDADRFVKAIGLWPALYTTDVLAGLGRYAICVIGTDKGTLQMPRRKGTRITYMQPYPEKRVTITRWDTDPKSSTFGRPLMYRINPIPLEDRVEAASGGASGIQSTPPEQGSFDVHASHVLHIARGSLDNPVFGVPYYTSVWNYLIDLMKVVGSSSESYWRSAYQGLHADVDQEMDLAEDDEKNLSEELDEYQHNLRRTIRTRGVTVKSLGSDVADPRGAFDVLLTLISGSTAIPKRILLGSEAGQLASTQDKGNWAERVEEYRTLHCMPNVLWPFLKWCVEYEVYEMDLNAVKALWPDAYRQSPLERGQTAAQTARTAANLIKAVQPIEVQAATPDTIDPVTGAVTPGQAAVTDEPLLTRDEARRLLGLSTDQALLIETPEDIGVQG